MKTDIYRNTILPLVLFGCEIWSLALMEERRLKVLLNRLFRIISGPKTDEVTGKWRKLSNEEINDLFCSPNMIPLKEY